ncbi:MAG: hypothetical protein JWR37_4401 [Mycobacterium sp.]|nr:hypothetical protein [Mycobacterium sp.]
MGASSAAAPSKDPVLRDASAVAVVMDLRVHFCVDIIWIMSTDMVGRDQRGDRRDGGGAGSDRGFGRGQLLDGLLQGAGGRSCGGGR